MKSPLQKRRTLTMVGGVAGAIVLATASLGTSAGAATKKPVPKVKVVVGKAAPDFGLQFVSDAQSVTAGQMATYEVNIVPTSTFKGAVVSDLPNLTDRFTGRLVAETTTRLRLEITVPPFANTNSGVFILRARSGDISHQAVFRLNVTARPVPTTTTSPPSASASTTLAPQFTLAPADTTRTVLPGEAAQYGIGVNRSSGSTDSVTLRVDGLPTGATANFAPNPTTAGSVLYVTPTATTPSGSYLLSVVGTAGSTTRAAAVQMIVKRTGDFALTLAPASVNVPAGNDGVSAVNVAPNIGSTSALSPDVTFTASGQPSGTVVLFDPNPSNGLTTVRVRTLANTPLTTYKVTITGTSGAFTHSTVLSVIVEKSTTGGFGLSASPVTATVLPGAAATYNMTIAPAGGFSSTIGLVVKNLPPYANFTVTNQTATAATIQVTTAANTPTGTFPLQITGTSGSLSATVEVTMVVATS